MFAQVQLSKCEQFAFATLDNPNRVADRFPLAAKPQSPMSKRIRLDLVRSMRIIDE